MSEINDEQSAIDFYQKRREEFLNFFRQKGLALKCPVCGKNQEEGFVLLGYGKEVTVLPVNILGKYYPTYSFACSNCGNVQIFSEAVLLRGDDKDE
ncbi:hypothetical protein FAI40_10170 [Acetobacteraceae bacterium]|nr:hypothetical protein FAI40_10170 [Acetobacteraceae bacterium]